MPRESSGFTPPGWWANWVVQLPGSESGGLCNLALVDAVRLLQRGSAPDRRNSVLILRAGVPPGWWVWLRRSRERSPPNIC